MGRTNLHQGKMKTGKIRRRAPTFPSKRTLFLWLIIAICIAAIMWILYFGRKKRSSMTSHNAHFAVLYTPYVISKDARCSLYLLTIVKIFQSLKFTVLLLSNGTQPSQLRWVANALEIPLNFEDIIFQNAQVRDSHLKISIAISKPLIFFSLGSHLPFFRGIGKNLNMFYSMNEIPMVTSEIISGVAKALILSSYDMIFVDDVNVHRDFLF